MSASAETIAHALEARRDGVWIGFNPDGGLLFRCRQHLPKANAGAAP